VHSASTELYNIGNNVITSVSNLGTIGLNFQVAGFGDFNADGTTDMMLRNTHTGALEIYDIKNNAIVSASSPGTVGPDFQVAGFGPFHAPAAFDMILRNKNTGEFEVYDVPRPTAWAPSAQTSKLAASPPIRRRPPWAARMAQPLSSCRRWPVSAGMQPMIPITSFLGTTHHSSHC
jgi:hypothetical protein